MPSSLYPSVHLDDCQTYWASPQVSSAHFFCTSPLLGRDSGESLWNGGTRWVSESKCPHSLGSGLYFDVHLDSLRSHSGGTSVGSVFNSEWHWAFFRAPAPFSLSPMMHEMSTDICPCLTASLFSKQKELLKCKTFFRSFSEEDGDKNDCLGTQIIRTMTR